MEQRLDQRLVMLGFAQSRERAKELIESGHVLVDDVIEKKPSRKVHEKQSVRLLQSDHPYVSRGGLKLRCALDDFGVGVNGMTILDVGASTGGFSDCLLQAGAKKIYAVDVGTAQLAERLRADTRVKNLWGLDIRDANSDQIPEKVAMIVMDVAFISLKKVLPSATAFAASNAQLLALVKPQFEVGPANVGKGGIVRNEQARRAACDEIQAFAASLGWTVVGVKPCKVLGTDGNQEFFLYAYIRS